MISAKSQQSFERFWILNGVDGGWRRRGKVLARFRPSCSPHQPLPQTQTCKVVANLIANIAFEWRRQKLRPEWKEKVLIMAWNACHPNCSRQLDLWLQTALFGYARSKRQFNVHSQLSITKVIKWQSSDSADTTSITPIELDAHEMQIATQPMIWK